MRHRVYGKHLGRNKDQRERLFKSLINSLFLHGSIRTSQEKAKAVKGLVDKVINLAKDKSRSSLLGSYLANEQMQNRLTKEIAPKMGTRTSGYTSLIRLGQRLGDNTMMVRMSLIGIEKLKPLEKVTSDKKQVTRETETKKATSKKIITVKKLVKNSTRRAKTAKK